MVAAASFELTAELKDLPAITQWLEQATSNLGVAPEQAMDVLVALGEAITNTLTHGYGGSPGYLEIEVIRQQDALLIRLRDQAPSFDPTAVPAPDVTVPLEQREPGGMGVAFIRHFVDEVYYCCTPDGENELTLVKRGSRA